MAVNVGSAVGYLDLDSKGFLQGLKEAESQAKLTGANLEAAVGKRLQSVGSSMQKAGKSMTAWVTTPILGAGAAAIKTTADFDEGMSKVSALSGATGKDLEDLRDKAKEMGAKTKYSATESAEAFQYMALAGWKTADMLDGIEGIMNLAAASGEDLASVSDIVTDGLTAFGMSAKQSGHFADVLASASANANTDVAGLGEAFKYVGPVAGAFGYSVEDVSIALGMMANAGIKGSSMGTSLRQALVQLTSPSDTAAMYMDKFGISLFDANGNTKDLMTVMQDLRGTFGSTLADIDTSEEAMQQLSAAVEADENAWYEYADSLNLPQDEQEKLTALTEIFGARAMPAMLAVIQGSDADFEKLTDAIYNATQVVDNSTGKVYSYAEAYAQFGDEIDTNKERFTQLSSSQKMAETMMDNLNGQITIIKSSLEGFAISIGELLMPKIRELAQKIQGLLDYFNSLDDAQKMQIIKIAGIVAAIGPVLLILGKVTSGIGSLLAMIGKIPGTITAVKGGITAFSTGFKNIFEAAKLARAGFTGFATETSVLGTALGSITAPIAAVIAIIAALVAAFVYLWQTNDEFRNNILGIWEHIKSSFENFCQGIVDRLNALGFEFEDITQVLMAIWDAFCQFLAPIFETVFNEIAVILDGVFSVLTGILDIFIGIFTGDWDTFLQGIQEVFGGIWNAITGTLDNILNNGILGILQVFTGNAELTWEDVWNGIAEFFSNIWQNIVSFFENIGQTLLQAISGFLQNVYTFFSELPGKIFNFLSSAFEHVAKWASDMWAKAIETGTNFLNAIVSFFIQLPGRILEFITSAWNNIVIWATNMVNKAREMAMNFLNNIVAFFTQLPGRILNFITSAWNNVVLWATNMVNKAREMAQNFLNNVVNFFTQLPGRILNFLNSAWNNVTTWAANMWNKASEMGRNFVNNAGSTISSLPGTIWNYLSQAISRAAQWVSDMASKGREAIQGLINNVMSAAGNIAGRVYSIGSDIVHGIWNGISNGFGWIQARISEWCDDVIGWFKSVLHIGSPSKLFADEIGAWIPPGIAQGFEKSLPGALGDMEDSLQDGIDEMSDVDVSGNAVMNVSEAVSGLKGIYDDVVNYFDSIEARMALITSRMLNDMATLISVGRYAYAANGFGYVGYNGFGTSPQSANVEMFDSEQAQGGGDTFIFNSPKPIDEIEAARQMRKTKQDMAEGF